MGYQAQTQIPGTQGDVLSVVAVDSTIFRVLINAEPSEARRLTLAARTKVASP